MATAESMSLRDMLFWFFLTLFGTGTYVIYRSQGEAGEVWGIAIIVVGFAGMVSCAWPLLKDPLTGRVQLTWGLIGRIIHHPLYRKAAMRLIVAYVAIYALIYVHSLRSDLDMYVMPRTITKRQSEALREYLSKHEAHPVTVRVNAYDEESLGFAGQVRDALKRTNWDVTFDTSPVDPKIHLGNGLSIDATGDIGVPDPKPRDPQDILREAFRVANIEVDGSSRSPGPGNYKLSIVVGHRRLVVGDQESTLSKIGRWIQTVGQ